MKLQPAYQVGFDRQTFTAYGFRLHPLTLGHVQLMAMMGSAIPWQIGDSIAVDDICGAVAVGIFPAWEDAHHNLTTNPDAPAEIGKAMALAGDKDEALNVVEWIAHYLQKPRSATAYDIMESRCPWWWTYAEFLQSELGRSEDAAWGTICSDAFCYYASFAARNGSKQFSTMREVILEDAVREGKTMKQLFEEGAI